ncbi:hypothetical protein GCM10027614_17870 [Micromonospora vulcania]
MHALAAWLAYRRAPGPASLAALRRLYPALVAQQRYLADRRDLGGDGLVCIVHPWESGLDNSPAWDEPMAAVQAEAAVMRAYRRHDTMHADAAHRPTDLDYARYLAIVAAYRDGGYSDRSLADGHPFLVECPCSTRRSGRPNTRWPDRHAPRCRPGPHRARAARITEAVVRRLYDPATGTFALATCAPTGWSVLVRCSGWRRCSCPTCRPRRPTRWSSRPGRRASGWPDGWTGRCPATTGPRRSSSRCATGAGRAG